MVTCSIDFETRSTVGLRKTGVYPYALHPHTDLWCFAYAFDDEPVQLWTPGLPFPARLQQHIAEGGELRAWNAQFERVIWRDLGTPRYGFPSVRLEQWVCTAAEAAAMALPRSLEQCAQVLRLQEQKDNEGHRLMMQMSKPRRWEGTTPIWWDGVEKTDRLGSYCRQDVVVERRVAKAVRRLGATERAVYVLDQQINDRGVRIDRPLIAAMEASAGRALRRSGELLTSLTGGAVTSPSQVGRIKTWLATQGVTAASLAKKPIADLLAGECVDVVRDVLEVRADAAKSSVAKLAAMRESACPDDYVRGLLLYHGAGTGRWSGRLVQPQNFPRPTIKRVEQFLPELLAGNDDYVDMLHPILEVISSSLRACLVASPGCRFLAADYAGIEARIVNWLAGQWDIVDVFARGESVYLHNARRLAEAHGTPLPLTASKTTHPQEYQIGKVIELGCGYGMGATKFLTTAAGEPYNLVLTEEQAKDFVDFYRTSHHRVKALWKDLNWAAIRAVEEPGTVVSAGTGAVVRFTRRGGYLWMILPSGRPLAYAEPRIEEREAPWSTPEKPARTRSVVASGIESQTRRWQEFFLYGGLLLENAVQAIARDIMAAGMLRVDAAGYPIILTVHDEVVVEAEEGHGSLAELQQLLVALPPWARALPGGRDLPLDTEGWEGDRYRK